MATKPAAKPVPRPSLKPVPIVDEEAVAEPKKKKPIVLIALIFLVLLIAAGGAGWYFLAGPGATTASAGAKNPKLAPKQVAKPPEFVNLEPFTVNLAGGEHYLQLGVVLQVADDKVSESAKEHMPQIRNALLLILSSKSPADLESTEGKQKLAAEILAETRKPMPEEDAKNVQSVLFSAFVVQ
jgi:flagellar FliL protein